MDTMADRPSHEALHLSTTAAPGVFDNWTPRAVQASAPPEPQPGSARYGRAQRVRVRNRFDGAWCAGFEVAGVVAGDEGRPPSYQLRRLSDGTVLPAQFPEDDLLHGT